MRGTIISILLLLIISCSSQIVFDYTPNTTLCGDPNFSCTEAEVPYFEVTSKVSVPLPEVSVFYFYLCLVDEIPMDTPTFSITCKDGFALPIKIPDLAFHSQQCIMWTVALGEYEKTVESLVLVRGLGKWVDPVPGCNSFATVDLLLGSRFYRAAVSSVSFEQTVLPALVHTISFEWPPQPRTFSPAFEGFSIPFDIYYLLTSFQAEPDQDAFFQCFSMSLTNKLTPSTDVVQEPYPPPQPSEGATGIQLTPLERCTHDSVRLPYQVTFQIRGTVPLAQEIQFDLTPITIPHGPVKVESHELFYQLQTFTQPTLYEITAISFTQLPSVGKILLASQPLTTDTLNQPFKLANMKFYFEPSFPACQRLSSSSSTCLDQLGAEQKFSMQYQLIAAAGLRQSSLIDHTIEFSSSLYSPTTVKTNVPNQISHDVSFSHSTYDPQNPSILDDFVVTIDTLPSNGVLHCIPFCFQDSCESVLVETVPFVTNNSSPCKYTSNGYNIDPNQQYDEFSWHPSHKTFKIGANQVSTSSIMSQRVNQAPSGTFLAAEFWGQVGKNIPLNFTVHDSDWDLPFSKSAYQVKLTSTNNRLRIYPSDGLAKSTDLITSSEVAFQFTATRETINQYIKGTSVLGTATCVAQVIVEIIDNDSDTWNGFVPTSKTVLLANILNGNQDNTTKESANSVIKNSAVLLSIVIGVPILLAIIVVVVCLRRRKRRKELELKRLELIEKKQYEVKEVFEANEMVVVVENPPEEAEGPKLDVPPKPKRKKKRVAKPTEGT